MDMVIDDFHQRYYNSLVWTRTKWLGIPVLKNPLDLMIYQEMLYDLKPDVLVECGTFNGGSALFFASLFDSLGKGTVISIDLSPQPALPTHPRIKYITASSTNSETLKQVQSMLKPSDSVIVVLDSDHSKEHVLKELQIYREIVTKGSYLIVEDTNINGHPVLPHFGPGPMEALQDFLTGNDQFEVDESKHKYLMTFNPRGYLRKVRC